MFLLRYNQRNYMTVHYDMAFHDWRISLA